MGRWMDLAPLTAARAAVAQPSGRATDGNRLSVADTYDHKIKIIYPLSAHAIELPLILYFQTSPGTHRAALDGEATFYWCREDNTSICMIQSMRCHMPIETSETAENRLLIVSTTAQWRDEVGSSLSPRAPMEYKGNASRE